MRSPRAHLAALRGVSLGLSPSFSWADSNTPLGILTVAYSARLNDTEAFPGCRCLTMKLFRRNQKAGLLREWGRQPFRWVEAQLRRCIWLPPEPTWFWHGVVLFKVPAGTLVEVQAEGAFLRAKNARGVQAEIKTLGPKALQVTPRRGNLEFLYREGRRVLPEGEAYRMRLDSPAGTATEEASGAHTAGISGKLTFFIVRAAAAGVTAWGVHAAVTSGNAPESPAKP